jgi:hypothetical protein
MLGSCILLSQIKDQSVGKIHWLKLGELATLICPECQLAKTVAVGKIRATNQHMITARCPCGHSFLVIFDFRKHYRKSTYLPVIYEKQPAEIENKDNRKAKVTGFSTMQAKSVNGEHRIITNISNGGLQFTRPWQTWDRGWPRGLNYSRPRRPEPYRDQQTRHRSIDCQQQNRLPIFRE